MLIQSDDNFIKTIPKRTWVTIFYVQIEMEKLVAFNKNMTFYIVKTNNEQTIVRVSGTNTS